MARWRKEAVRSWRRQPFAKNSTEVADWFFGSFESKEDAISNKAQSRAELAPRTALRRLPGRTKCQTCLAIDGSGGGGDVRVRLGQVWLATNGRAPFRGLAVHDDRVWGARDASNSPGADPGRRVYVPGIALVAMFIISLGNCARKLLVTLNRRALQDRTERATRAATLGLFALALFPILYICGFAIYVGRISRPGRAGSASTSRLCPSARWG